MLRKGRSIAWKWQEVGNIHGCGLAVVCVCVYVCVNVCVCVCVCVAIYYMPIVAPSY